MIRALSEKEDSPLNGEIKLLGVGRGRVSQAPLAQELKKLFAANAFGEGKRGETFRDEDAKKFFVNYFKQVATVFGAAWNGRTSSTSTSGAAALIGANRTLVSPEAEASSSDHQAKPAPSGSGPQAATDGSSSHPVPFATVCWRNVWPRSLE